MNMYAIVADGGRQYKVEEGQILDIDFRELKPGEDLVFDRVLAISNGEDFRLGTPTVAGASVKAVVVGEALGEKLVVQYFRRRKNSRRRTGHRQQYVRVKITGIAG
jgi:large subunit ribosomal protein L21